MGAQHRHRTRINWRDAEFDTYSLQGQPQRDITWRNISYDEQAGCGFFLVRFAPGGVSIPHEHLAYEEFVVLEGELQDHDGTVYRAGDCVSLSPGTKHNTRSDGGATVAVFIRGGFRTLEQGEAMPKIADRKAAAARPARAVKAPARARPAGGRTPGSPGRSRRA